MKHLLTLLLLTTSLSSQATELFETPSDVLPFAIAGVFAAKHSDDSLTPWAVVAQMADWSQTLKIEKHPELQEGGSFGILGKHPTRGNINLFFASKILLTMWLDNKFYNGFWIGVSGGAVGNNLKFGIQVGF